jgi:hypothetical protein
MKTLSQLAVAATVSLFTALPAAALAVECVKPTGAGACYATIQEAVDAASAGETIAVYPGRYAGGVTVPVAKTGVKLVGMGATPAAVVVGGVTSWGFRVEAANVTVQNLTVAGVADGIFFSTPGGRITKVVVRGAAGYGIGVLGADAVIRDSVVTGTSDDGITTQFGAPYGENLLVTNTVVTQARGACLNLGGLNTRVVGSRIENCQQDAMYIDGEHALVEKNTIRGTQGGAIRIANSFGIVRGNRVAGAANYAIDVGGDNPVVRDNVVTDTVSTGFNVSCSDCSAAVVADNVADNVFGGTGFVISASNPGLLVQGNVARGCKWGINVAANGARIAGNSAVASGRQDAGITVSGTGNTVTGNLCRDNGNGGFLVMGTGHQLAANRATGNGGSGFVVAGVSIELVGNTASGNALRGILVDPAALSATLRRNTAVRNNPDFCDQGAGTILGTGVDANHFGTTCP